MELKLKYMISTGTLTVKLLIVPYGIETLNELLFCNFHSILLIVPYGIETRYPGLYSAAYSPFNRTLWN